MNRLVLSTAALTLIVAPALAQAKTHHAPVAKHKVVKTTKTTKTKTEAK